MLNFATNLTEISFNYLQHIFILATLNILQQGTFLSNINLTQLQTQFIIFFLHSDRAVPLVNQVQLALCLY